MSFKKNYLVTSYLLMFITVLSGVTLINGCKNKITSQQPYKLTGNVLVDGQNLVQLKCTRCHALVPVNALSKNVWERHVLPYMATFMHISIYGSIYYKSNIADTAGASIEEWLAIVEYYKKAAPDTIVAAKKPIPLSEDWAGFTLKKPEPVNYTSFTTMVAVNPYTHKLYSADFTGERIFGWDSNLKPDSLGALPSPAVSVSFAKDTTGSNVGYFSCVGRLEPVDFPNGKVVKINLDKKNNDPTLVASDLPRPQQTVLADFNKDGLTDMVVCGQGNLKGGVFLLKQNHDHSYTQETIDDKSGAVQALTGDFNKDGWPDLMVLTGSGDEGLNQYLNNQKGGFTKRSLLRFPPVYGSTSFQLADIDHDGNPDLIYTCGYNYRDSRRIKPYHGLYIYTNTGDWNFKQRWFYPINGCTKAIAADFDDDGDLDIATIAFFADMKNTPAEEFIYFEQTKPFDFKPHAIPVSQYGRWMCMEVADLNNDHKPDIILGNYSSGFMFLPDFKPTWDENLPLIVLENHTKK
jgi:hypothetical protein